MKNFKAEYEELVGALDDFIANTRAEAKEEQEFGDNYSRAGLLFTLADDLEDLVYEDYPRCEGCEKILKDEDNIFTFDDEKEKYCKKCFEYEVDERWAFKKYGHPSLTDEERNR